MSTSAETLFIIILFGACYDVLPVMLIWGWIRWIRQPMLKQSDAILSLIGFIFVTASAVLAASLILYDQLVAGFADYDPLLIRAIRIGAVLSLAAVVVGIGALFGIGGVSRTNRLSWHAPISAVLMLVFWICAAAGK
jgi:hypothetical protein